MVIPTGSYGHREEISSLFNNSFRNYAQRTLLIEIKYLYNFLRDQYHKHVKSKCLYYPPCRSQPSSQYTLQEGNRDRSESHSVDLDTARVGTTPSLHHLVGKLWVVLLEFSWSFSKQNNDGINGGCDRSQKDAAQN